MEYPFIRQLEKSLEGYFEFLVYMHISAKMSYMTTSPGNFQCTFKRWVLSEIYSRGIQCDKSFTRPRGLVFRQ